MVAFLYFTSFDSLVYCFDFSTTPRGGRGGGSVVEKGASSVGKYVIPSYKYIINYHINYEISSSKYFFFVFFLNIFYIFSLFNLFFFIYLLLFFFFHFFP